MSTGISRQSTPHKNTRLWVLNHVANPIVRALLRSPLHPLLSGSVLLLTYEGKRSGRRYTFPAQYARDGESVYIVAGEAEGKTWWRNLRTGSAVSVRLRGQDLPGRVDMLSGDVDARTRELTIYLKRFPAVAARQGIQQGPDIARVAAGVVLVRITLMMPASF